MNRRTLLGFAVGPVGAAALSMISLPVMTWIFPPEAIGKLSMLQVAIQFSTLLFCLGFDQAYVREYHESISKHALFLNATVPGVLLMLVTLSALLLVAPMGLAQVLYGYLSVEASLMTAACLVVAYVSRFLSLILRMENRGLAFSMSQLLGKLLLLVMVLMYARLPVARTFELLLVAQAVALLLTLLVFSWNARREWLPALRARLRVPVFRRLFSFGWPLVFGGLASWGLATLDRIFLRSMSSYDQLAVYSVSASIASGVTIFSGVFNIIWAPMVFKWVADNVDLSRVELIAKQVSSIMLMLVCIAGGCSWLLQYLLPASYQESVYLIVGCMIAPMFYTLSEVTGIGITVSRRTGFALMASLSAVLLNTVLCLILVPQIGATGAMIATAAAFWLFFVLRTEFSAAIWRQIERKRIHTYGLLALVASVSYGVLGRIDPGGAIIAWWAALAVVVYADRHVLRSIWSAVRRPQGENAVAF